MRSLLRSAMILCMIFLVFIPIASGAAASEQKRYIYDEAGLLTKQEIEKLETLAAKLGAERETDFIIVTTNDTNGRDVKKYAEDFYDEKAPGYQKKHGNAAVLTVDMEHREVYLAGFKKAEEYLNDARLDKIREKIMPDISDNHYEAAFEMFMKAAYDDMEKKPWADSIFFKTWFQLLVSAVIAAIAVVIMKYNSGGKVTVSASTYMNGDTSGVIRKNDEYIRTTVTKQRKPSNNKSSGGGTTSGGHSHSGSRGSF
ncbi:TPM domain-containing protein [Bacillus haynesii]|uniref:TPM domain-containing protein n=1 Tax=Bacillus haynesii TaxID=1925021 RepID=UPI00227F3CE3|nr:TPM domain-containing protein [Bacillus haynesii]MCY7771768.1 TPM domain-containing protein [Bacillus haynesii]MCY8068020.1 TPM domain-containing protein [Bacillus haynesii]MCY8102652.1 TPM domain-containing protein [Bacillus haynesii]MCY8343481.1 TPM domain-containing protein [Bacillus haynesii]MCY8469767.1 TPM domain-containing protein [Bacillus haynesii]